MVGYHDETFIRWNMSPHSDAIKVNRCSRINDDGGYGAKCRPLINNPMAAVDFLWKSKLLYSTALAADHPENNYVNEQLLERFVQWGLAPGKA